MSVEVSKELTTDRTVALTVTDSNFDETYVWIDEQEALELVARLVEVFAVEADRVEVLVLPRGCTPLKRVDILRKAAARIEAREIRI